MGASPPDNARAPHQEERNEALRQELQRLRDDKEQLQSDESDVYEHMQRDLRSKSSRIAELQRFCVWLRALHSSSGARSASRLIARTPTRSIAHAVAGSHHTPSLSLHPPPPPPRACRDLAETKAKLEETQRTKDEVLNKQREAFEEERARSAQEIQVRGCVGVWALGKARERE